MEENMGHKESKEQCWQETLCGGLVLWLLYHLNIWELLMGADHSFSLNKHFYFPVPCKALLMIWESS